MEMTVRIEVFAADADASAEFYRRVLGFEELARQHNGDRVQYVSVGRGAVRIGIGTSWETVDPSDRRTPSGTEIVLEVDDVEEEFTRIRAAGWPFESELRRQHWGLRDFRLFDPDGYYLRITSRD
jgi:lactoylglutathione lyase